jgi:hypothetical protein
MDDHRPGPGEDATVRRPEADVPALVDLLMNVQQLALEAGNYIEELDINRVMIRPRGHGVTAVDALVVPRRA